MNTHEHPVAEAWGQVIQRQREHVTDETRAELADRIGVTRQMVRLWEEGVHAPSPKMQAHLIKHLGIDPVEVAQLIRKATSNDNPKDAA